jgi:trans-2,3-dihydro-3-hydroxyanthranilate isomerase
MNVMNLDFVTVDVFTRHAFGGNPLAVFFASDPQAASLTPQQMKRIAAEMNYSETTFVLPPVDPANTARLRIFTPKSEMPFAGHPNVGSGFVLASYPEAVPVTGRLELKTDELGGGQQRLMRFEEQAGLVEVAVTLDVDGKAEQAQIAAPRPFEQRPGHSAQTMADALGLSVDQIVAAHGGSTIVSVGIECAVVEVVDPAALAACQPQVATFSRLSLSAQLPDLQAEDEAQTFLVYVYCRIGSKKVRSRMFDPLHGIPEDPATGSAAGALAGLLADRDALQGTARYTFAQGEEMGRPSRITVDVVRDKGQILQTYITGYCVEVIQGTFRVPGK